MNYEAFFRMGSKHAVCQDYAIAGTWFRRPYAIVSDGCSGVTDPKDRATPYTDWGARLLAWHAREALGPISEGFFPDRVILGGTLGISKILLLPRDSMAATLLVAVQTASGDLLAHQVGDGVIAWRERGGAIGYETVRYAGGAPRYLCYLGDEKAHQRLLELKSEDDDLEPGTYEVTKNRWQEGCGWDIAERRIVRFDAETPYARQIRFPKEVDPAGSLLPPVETVALFSDGIESFTDREQRSVELEDVLLPLLSFKSYSGEFVTRRCRKFLEVTCAEKGWRHEDDFSMAVLTHLPEAEADSKQQTAPDLETGSREPVAVERSETSPSSEKKER